MQLQLKNEEASFNALLSAATEVAEKCKMIKVTDEVTLAIARQQISSANSLLKQIEGLRKEFKEEPLRACQQIDALAKNLATPISSGKEVAEQQVLAYNREVQRKQQEEVNRIQAIKNEMAQFNREAMKAMDNAKTMDELRVARETWVIQSKGKYSLPEFEAIRATLNDYAKSRRIAIETPQEAMPEETAAIKEAVEIKVEAIPEVAVQADIKGIKRKWTFEIIDEVEVPKALMSPDEKKIKEFIKQNEDKMTEGVVSGIRFFQEEKLSIR